MAIPFANRWIALYPPSPGTPTAPACLQTLPIDQEVLWAGPAVPIQEARPHDVCWLDEPILDRQGVRGSLVVHALVDNEEGIRWSPKVAVTLKSGELDAQILGATLVDGELEVDWGSDGTHIEAVAAFLESQQALLWRIHEGGPGIDAAWRVQQVCGPSAGYKRWAVEDLVRHADEVVPGLVDILKAAVQGHGDIHDLGPLYALAVLTHLKVREAHDPLLTLARLKADDFEDMFGAFLTEQFDAVLLRTSGGDISGIRELLRDPTADGYVRSQAASALVGATEMGLADRAMVLRTLAGLLVPDAAADPDSYVWCGVGSAIMDLRGVEVKDQLIEACKTGLIDPIHFGVAEVHDYLHRDRRELSECQELATCEDVHQWIGGWASFIQ